MLFLLFGSCVKNKDICKSYIYDVLSLPFEIKTNVFFKNYNTVCNNQSILY